MNVTLTTNTPITTHQAKQTNGQDSNYHITTQPKIYLKVTLKKRIAGRKQPNTTTVTAGGYTPMEALINAVKFANKHDTRTGYTAEDITNVTRDGDLPAIILIHIPN